MFHVTRNKITLFMFNVSIFLDVQKSLIPSLFKSIRDPSSAAEHSGAVEEDAPSGGGFGEVNITMER